MYQLHTSYLKQLNQFTNKNYKSPKQVKLYRGKQNYILNYADKYIIKYCICKSPVIRIADKFRSEIQIIIKTIDDKILTLEMKLSSKIRNVKTKIQKKTKLSADQQNLYFQGEILNDDNKTIYEYQICDKSVINIVAGLRGGMKLIAKTKDGKTLSFEVLKSDKIIDVKNKLQEKIGLHRVELTLTYQDKILDEEDKTIDEYQICENSEINIVDGLRCEIQIFDKTKCGKTITLEVQKSDKIIDIEKKIQEKTGLNPDEQILIYQIILLDEDKTIGDYQICEKSEIDIVARLRGGMQIFAKTFDGKTVDLEVQKSDKIIDIKYKIQKKTGLNPDEQKLFYGQEVLNDNKTVDEYQICEKSLINIVDNSSGVMKISAETTDGSTVIIEAQKTDKMIDIKQKIQEKTGLHPDEQKLIYQGEKMKNDKTIDEYQICDKCMIKVETKSIYGRKKMFFKTIDGKTFPFEIQKSYKIIDIKYKIQNKTGLNPDEQILIYQGGILEDDKTVGAYKIREKSVIDIFVRPKNEIQIFIKISNKSIIPINIAKFSKIIDMKTKVEEQTGMQFAGNNLIYENNILHNDKLLIDYQIDNGCVISIDSDSQFFIFLQAIKSGSLESVKDLYDIKFNKEICSSSPMHVACKQHNAEIVKFLIENSFKITSIDNELKKPIHYACINGCVKILQTLIEYNCSVEECDSHGMKPIHLACLNGNFQNVKLLIEKECNLESQDYSSSRPLHLACLSGNIDIVKLLLQNKCRIDVLNKSDESPINIAEKENHIDIITIINEEISIRMMENMIRELNLECDNSCDHNFCRLSLSNKEFHCGDIIGHGAYGVVYRPNLSQGSQKIAIKEISINETNSKNIEGNINSYLLIKKINHNRIIKYYGAITKQEKIYIFMEFMIGGSLRSQIYTNVSMKISKVINYTIQIIEGLQFLHNNKIIHRDIKPDNILLDNDGNVKLTDLGSGLLLGKFDSRTAQAYTFCGTTYYMAPEIINGEPYSYGADIWSLGVTVIEMATGKVPYPDISLPQAVMFRIGKSKTIPYQWPESSSNIKQIIDDMLNPEPFKRPSATVLLYNFKTILK